MPRFLKIPIIIFITESITQSYSEAIIKKTQASLTKNRVLKLIDEHRSILKAISDKNPVKAYDRTKQHLLDTYEMYTGFTRGQAMMISIPGYDRGHGGSGF